MKMMNLLENLLKQTIFVNLHLDDSLSIFF